MKKYIAYYRVSTIKQGDSGLGLDAQRSAVERFIQFEQQRNTGQQCILYAEFKDIESGRNDYRPGINDAITMCRSFLSKGIDVVLLIAKLDRLSRSVAFISTLQNSNVRFIACDMPDANNLTINIMAAMAQQEAEIGSIRTKAALKSKLDNNPDGWYNKHGEFCTKLGYPKTFTQEGRNLGIKNLKLKAENNQDNIKAMNYSYTLRNMGMSFRQIADKLNIDGFNTVNGSSFTKMQVKRLLDRKNEQISKKQHNFSK